MLQDIIEKLITILGQEGNIPVVINSTDMAHSVNELHISVDNIKLHDGVITNGNVKAVVLN